MSDCVVRRPACAAAALMVMGWISSATPMVRADNWPQWRGPGLNGISEEKNPPVQWGVDKGVKWRLPLPGAGGATPVVWDDTIFVTSAAGDNLVLLAVDTAGELKWQRKLGTGNRVVRDGEGNSASPSPCTDGKHVWAMMATGDLACFNFAGNSVWAFNLQDRYGKFNIQFGMTSTPLLVGDRLYLQLIHSGGAHVIALDKATGAEVWKQKRPSDAYAENEHSYASPVLYRDDKQEFLLTHGADYVIAHRLSDGAELWRCGGLNPKSNYNPTLRLVASPACAPGLIVVPSAKNGPVLGLMPDGVGDRTDKEAGRAWLRKQNTPDVSSPLIHDGVVYLCRENGVLIALDARTGEELYQENCHRQRHRASPLLVDGKIFLAAADGMVTVVQAGRTFKKLASNEMRDPIAASLVFANGVMYVRTYENLFAIAPSR